MSNWTRVIEICVTLGIETEDKSLDSLLDSIKKDVESLVKSEQERDSWYKRERDNLRAYYRRRIGYIRKLSVLKGDPVNRLEQILNNCDEVLQGDESLMVLGGQE